MKKLKHIWYFSWKQIKNLFPLQGTTQGKMSNINWRSYIQKLFWTAQCVLWRFYQFDSLKENVSCQMAYQNLHFVTSLTTKKCTYWLFKYNWVIRKKLGFLLRERNIWKLQKEISAVLDPFCEYTKLLNSTFLFKGLRLEIQKKYWVIEW